MQEIPPHEKISHFFQNLYLAEPFLSDYELFDSNLLIKKLKEKNGLSGLSTKSKTNPMEILEQGFEKIKKGKGFGSIEKYRWYNNYMLKEISLPDVYNPFYDKIPIFVNGLCVTQHNKPRKEGMDPYSNTHRFSTLLIQSLEQLFPPDFLERFLFVYVQPVPFVQKITKHKGKLCLEDIIRHPIEHHVNKNLAEKKKQGFGTLIKSDDSSYKIANAHYDPKLFNFNMFKIANAQNPDSKTREAMKSGRSFNKFLEIKQNEIYFNKQIMAIKFARFLDAIYPNLIKLHNEIGLNGLPIYMENTSDSAKILQYATKYSKTHILNCKDKPNDKTSLRYFNIGDGILNNTPERIPIEGIAHSSALNKLFGFMQAIYSNVSKNYKRKSVKIKKPARFEVITYDSGHQFPWLLLEQGTKGKHPNLHDLARQVLTTQEQKLIKDFAEENRLGFTRVEPAITTLLKTDYSINISHPALSKLNGRWFSEILGKKVLTPDKLHSPDYKINFFDMPSVHPADHKVTSDFRGSEFSQPTCEYISQDWHNPDQLTGFGCSITKLIGKIDRNVKKKLILEQLAQEPEEVRDEFFKNMTPDLESIPAIRGTAIHTLFAHPMNELVHYNTLEFADIDPVPSDVYTETTFFHKLKLQARNSIQEFTVSMHPDLYLFLKRGTDEYDLIIGDVKTNPRMVVPEHKYTQQTGFYGWFIKHIVEEELRVKIHNIYTFLYKTNFFERGDEPQIKYPSSLFRPPVLSKIILHKPDDSIIQTLPYMLANIMEEKQMLKEDKKFFGHYIKHCEKKKYCKKCFPDSSLVCKRLRNLESENKNINKYFN